MFVLRMGTGITIAVIVAVELMRRRARTVAVAPFVIIGIHAHGSGITIGADIVTGRGATSSDQPDLAVRDIGCLPARGQPFFIYRSLRL